MAREYAPIRLDIWSDDEFRDLTAGAQHLYFVLTTSPTLTYAGTADWRPARIGALAREWGKTAVEGAARELAERLFIVIDEDTEEVLIRSFVKHDGLLKNPKTAVSMALAFASIASKHLRAVLVFELRKLREKQPDLKGWDTGKVAQILDRAATDPATFPTDYPQGLGVGLGVDQGVGHPVAQGVDQGVGLPQGSLPTPAPTPEPSTSNEVDEGGAEPGASAPTPAPRKRSAGTRITEDWQPTRADVDKLRPDTPDVDLKTETANFVDYWLAKPGRDGEKLDWTATWRKWMRKAQQDITTRSQRTGPNRGSYGIDGRKPTSRERKIAEAETRKTQPNPEILRRGGLHTEADRIEASLAELARPQLIAIEGELIA